VIWRKHQVTGALVVRGAIMWWSAVGPDSMIEVCYMERTWSGTPLPFVTGSRYNACCPASLLRSPQSWRNRPQIRPSADSPAEDGCSSGHCSLGRVNGLCWRPTPGNGDDPLGRARAAQGASFTAGMGNQPRDERRAPGVIRVREASAHLPSQRHGARCAHGHRHHCRTGRTSRHRLLGCQPPRIRPQPGPTTDYGH
jgi:hypothetical protein